MESKWKASFVPPCWFTNIEIIVTSRALNLPSQPSCHWHQNSVWEWSHQPWHRHCWHNAWKLYPFYYQLFMMKGNAPTTHIPLPTFLIKSFFFESMLVTWLKRNFWPNLPKTGNHPTQPTRISAKNIVQGNDGAVEFAENVLSSTSNSSKLIKLDDGKELLPPFIRKGFLKLIFLLKTFSRKQMNLYLARVWRRMDKYTRAWTT